MTGDAVVVQIDIYTCIRIHEARNIFIDEQIYFLVWMASLTLAMFSASANSDREIDHSKHLENSWVHFKMCTFQSDQCVHFKAITINKTCEKIIVFSVNKF